jgi:hypothetical protein
VFFHRPRPSRLPLSRALSLTRKLTSPLSTTLIFGTTYGRRIEAPPTKSYYREEFGRLFTRRARTLADVASESEQEIGLGNGESAFGYVEYVNFCPWWFVHHEADTLVHLGEDDYLPGLRRILSVGGTLTKPRVHRTIAQIFPPPSTFCLPYQHLYTRPHVDSCQVLRPHLGLVMFPRLRP